MADRFEPEVPELEITLYSVPESLKDQAFHVMTMVWNGKPEIADSKGLKDAYSFVISFLTRYTARDFKPAFKEAGMKVKEMTLTQQTLVGWQSVFKGRKFEDLPNRHILLINNMILMMLCAKQPTEANYNDWSLNRARALMSVYQQEWQVAYQPFLMTLEWAKLVARVAQSSREFRINILGHVFDRSAVSDYNKRAFCYVMGMLRYARLTTILITRLYVTADPNQKILQDPYLAADREAWICALRALEKFPLALRPYAGIIADEGMEAVLGGQQLHNITYIALVVGARKQESLNNFTKPKVSHQAKLDELIAKYFPPDPILGPLESHDEIETLPLFGVRPLDEKMLARFTTVIRASEGLGPMRGDGLGEASVQTGQRQFPTVSETDEKRYLEMIDPGKPATRPPSPASSG